MFAKFMFSFRWWHVPIALFFSFVLMMVMRYGGLFLPWLGLTLIVEFVILLRVVVGVRKSMKEKRESVNFPLSPYGACLTHSASSKSGIPGREKGVSPHCGFTPSLQMVVTSCPRRQVPGVSQVRRRRLQVHRPRRPSPPARCSESAAAGSSQA